MDNKNVQKLDDNMLNEVTGGVGGFISNWSRLFSRNNNKTEDISKTDINDIDLNNPTDLA